MSIWQIIGARAGRRESASGARWWGGESADGSVFPMDLSVGEVKLARGRMFTGIVRDITERKRLEKEILEISDNEQKRIGQDLHDGLGQHLAGLELMSEVLQQKLLAKKSSEADRAQQITTHVREAIQQARLLARGLSPFFLESEGITSALRHLAANSEKLFRIRCEFSTNERGLSLDHAAGTHLYRIAQEAVSNGVRHGQGEAHQNKPRCGAGQKIITLCVKDFGVGLADKGRGQRGHGFAHHAVSGPNDRRNVKRAA